MIKGLAPPFHCDELNGAPWLDSRRRSANDQLSDIKAGPSIGVMVNLEVRRPMI
jgi:hypothetical protein